jgi:hypothetical protein
MGIAPKQMSIDQALPQRKRNRSLLESLHFAPNKLVAGAMGDSLQGFQKLLWTPMEDQNPVRKWALDHEVPDTDAVWN